MQWSSNILSFLSVSSFKLVKKKKKYRFICKNVKKYLCTIIICVTYRTLPLVKNKNKCRILKHTAFRLLWKYIFFLYISKKSQQSSKIFSSSPKLEQNKWMNSMLWYLNLSIAQPIIKTIVLLTFHSFRSPLCSSALHENLW